MIKSNIGLEIDYSTLEKILQERLSQNDSLGSLLKVNCFQRDDALLIIVEHSEDIISNHHQFFRIIRNTVKEKNIVEDILIYLVVHGNNEGEFFTKINGCSNKNYPLALNNYLSINKEKTSNKSNLSKPKKTTNHLLISLGIGTTILGVSLLSYLFSRPCVINNCSLIPETSKFVEESLFLLHEDNEDNEDISLEKIAQNLTQAIERLNTIPSWSPSYSQAQELIANYQLKIEQIQQGMKAIELANQAKIMSKNAPLSVKKWQEVVKLWQQSISLLQKIPQDNNNTFFNKKEKEYQENLVIVRDKIQQEEEGKKYLLAAKDAAKLGESRQNSAKSLADLQLVEATWKTAVQRLEKIPFETTAAVDKQDLLNTYTTKFLEAQQRRKQEESGINLYNQAVKQAQSAKQHQINNQLSSSVLAWQKALELLNKINPQNFQYPEAVQLLSIYQQELYKVRAQLQIKLVIEQAKNDLKNTCLDLGKICNYSVNSNLIKVFFTNKYLAIIEQLKNQSIAHNNNSNEKLINHISQLEKNFKYISSKYLIPLEIYHPNGDLMIKYEPKM